MANTDSFEKVYVLVLYTGGTIGMKETSDGKKVNSLSYHREGGRSDCGFSSTSFMTPCTIILILL